MSRLNSFFRNRYAIFISAFLGCFFATLFVFLWIVQLSKASLIESLLSVVPKKPLHGVNILVVGIDESKFVQRSDTIIIVHLNQIKDRIGVLSIPRDTRVNIPTIGTSKINHAYAHGGIPTLQNTISQFLNIPIDYYIKIDLKGIQQIVDKLGGIPVYIPKRLRYHDYAGNLHIDFTKGHTIISGNDVGKYLRFRHDKEGDIGRIKRQQSFIKSMAKKILDSGNIFTSTKLLKNLIKHMETDLSAPQMLGFAKQFSAAFKYQQIKTGSIPGAVSLIEGISYWRPDIKGIDDMVDSVLFGFSPKDLIPHTLSSKRSISKDEHPWPIVHQASISSVPTSPKTTTPSAQDTPSKSSAIVLQNTGRVPSKKTQKIPPPSPVLAQASPPSSSELPAAAPSISQRPSNATNTTLRSSAATPAQRAHSSTSYIQTPDKKASRENRRKITLTELTRITEHANPKDIVAQLSAKKDMKIEVLNGYGESGMARIAAKLLKSAGFHIARYDNSGSYAYEKTMIVDWKDNLQNSIVLVDYLSIDPENIIVYDKPSKSLDVTIVLGKDWRDIIEKLKPNGRNGG